MESSKLRREGHQNNILVVHDNTEIAWEQTKQKATSIINSIKA